MSRKIIAVIKLAPGQVGYYDEVSGVYLTTVSNVGNVYQGMNTTRLQQAVKLKKLIIVSGSLVPIQPFSVETECVEQVKATKTVEAKVAKAAAETLSAPTGQVEEKQSTKKKSAKKAAAALAEKVEGKVEVKAENETVTETETEVKGE